MNVHCQNNKQVKKNIQDIQHDQTLEVAIAWCMLLVNDVVLVDGSDRVDMRMELWRIWSFPNLLETKKALLVIVQTPKVS